MQTVCNNENICGANGTWNGYNATIKCPDKPINYARHYETEEETDPEQPNDMTYPVGLIVHLTLNEDCSSDKTICNYDLKCKGPM